VGGSATAASIPIPVAWTEANQTRVGDFGGLYTVAWDYAFAKRGEVNSLNDIVFVECSRIGRQPTDRRPSRRRIAPSGRLDAGAQPLILGMERVGLPRLLSLSPSPDALHDLAPQLWWNLRPPRTRSSTSSSFPAFPA